MTPSENTQHAFRNGLLNPLCGVDHPHAKLTIDDVIYIKEHYISGDRTYGSRALGKKFNINHSTILDIINCRSYVNV